MIKQKRLIGIIIAVSLLLLIPLVAMQYTEEVKWKVFDFIVAAVLLLGTVLFFESILRKIKSPKVRIAVGFGFLLIFLLLWIELAVGIFGTPFAGS